jgi:hypothetical protein
MEASALPVFNLATTVYRLRTRIPKARRGTRTRQLSRVVRLDECVLAGVVLHYLCVHTQYRQERKRRNDSRPTNEPQPEEFVPIRRTWHW